MLFDSMVAILPEWDAIADGLSGIQFDGRYRFTYSKHGKWNIANGIQFDGDLGPEKYLNNHCVEKLMSCSVCNSSGLSPGLFAIASY